MSAYINRKYGIYKVLYELDRPDRKHRKFKVRCLVCGAKTSMYLDNLVRHLKTKARGCSRCYHPSKKHGMYSHVFYKVWEGMIRRCYCEKHEAYHRYGGRGISVCREWRQSPKAFIRWLENNGAKKGLQIDRMDNDGNYSPDNCRIVTDRINKNNSSTNRRFMVYGELLTIAEAARKYKLKYTTIRERLQRGWNGNEAVREARKYGN